MDSLNEQWSRSSSWVRVAIFVALPSAGYLAARLRNDYQGWLALGPGGLPYSFRGYLTNLLVAGIFGRRETKVLKLYEHPEKYAVGWKQASPDEKANAQKSFLSQPLSQRSGPQSKSKHYCAPQREHNAGEYFNPDLKEAYSKAFDDLADKHSDAIEWKTSVLERYGKAMFLKHGFEVPTLIAKCQREVTHIHTSDMTGHVLLSFADARQAIEKGWGEQHRMTGSSVIPLGYTLLYLPRNIDETEVFLRIFEAGIEYAKSNGRAG